MMDNRMYLNNNTRAIQGYENHIKSSGESRLADGELGHRLDTHSAELCMDILDFNEDEYRNFVWQVLTRGPTALPERLAWLRERGGNRTCRYVSCQNY